MKLKVAVLMGGNSAEREVSLKSGLAVTEGLRIAGFDAIAIDTRDYSVLNLKKDGFDKAFISLHGKGGEDGSIQALLDYLGIPYTGSRVLASAVGMDKLRCKLIWQGAGLPTGRYVWLNKQALDQQWDPSQQKEIANLGYPLFVKPATEGSSVGIHRVNNADSLRAAMADAFQYDENILLEAFLSGSEYTVGIIGDKVLPPVRIQASNEFYDYNAKYLSDETQYFCPSGLDSTREAELMNLAAAAWKTLGGAGWGRVDVMQDDLGDFQLLEVNTSPGMTNHSLVPMAARQVGIEFPQLVAKILDLAG